MKLTPGSRTSISSTRTGQVLSELCSFPPIADWRETDWPPPQKLGPCRDEAQKAWPAVAR